jgi:hypothetical protein
VRGSHQEALVGGNGCDAFLEGRSHNEVPLARACIDYGCDSSTTSDGSLSSRHPRNVVCQSSPSSVHSANATSGQVLKAIYREESGKIGKNPEFAGKLFLEFLGRCGNTFCHIPLVPSGTGREAATCGLCFFMALRANAYIDGFNLYYGCLRKSPHKWLDLNALCSRLLPTNQVNLIRYFTAAVTSRPNDPRQAQRQQAYLRALATLPNVSITMGHFLTNKVWLMRTDYSGKVEVFKTEEKGF